MMVITGILIALLGLAGIVLSRWITAFIHESGHTLSALILTRGEVHMFVGSFGNLKETREFGVGRLILHFRMNLSDLRLGKTRFSHKESDWKSFLILLFGPFFSLATFLILLYLIFQPIYPDGLKFIFAVFMASSLIDLFINLIPSGKSINALDKRDSYNDMDHLLQIFTKRKSNNVYYALLKAVEEGATQKASAIFERLDDQLKNNIRFKLIKLEIDFLNQDSASFFAGFDEVAGSVKIPKRIIAKWGRLKLQNHRYDEVVKVMSKFLSDGISNYDFHLLRGKALTALSEYREALFDFNALTLGDEIDPLGLANRAYCQYRLGYVKEAKEDIQHALKLDNGLQGEIFFIAGKIYEESDEGTSLDYFRKSKALGYDHHSLDFQISWLEGSKDSSDF